MCTLEDKVAQYGLIRCGLAAGQLTLISSFHCLLVLACIWQYVTSRRHFHKRGLASQSDSGDEQCCTFAWIARGASVTAGRFTNNNCCAIVCKSWQSAARP